MNINKKLSFPVFFTSNKINTKHLVFTAQCYKRVLKTARYHTSQDCLQSRIFATTSPIDFCRQGMATIFIYWSIRVVVSEVPRNNVDTSSANKIDTRAVLTNCKSQQRNGRIKATSRLHDCYNKGNKTVMFRFDIFIRQKHYNPYTLLLYF